MQTPSRALFAVLATWLGSVAAAAAETPVPRFGDSLVATVRIHTLALRDTLALTGGNLRYARAGETFPVVDSVVGWIAVNHAGTKAWAPRVSFIIAPPKAPRPVSPWPYAAGALGVALAGTALWIRRRRRVDEWRRQWVLLAVPPETASALAPAFTARGWEVQTLEAPSALDDALVTMRPALVIAHQPTHGERLGELETREAAIASTPILFLDAHLHPSDPHPMRRWLIGTPPPPQVLSEAERLVRARPGPAQLSRIRRVEGALHSGALLEFLHFLCSAQRTGCVELEAGRLKGWIWLRDGRVEHAAIGPMRGEQALWNALDLVVGTFAFRAGVAPPEVSIHTGTLVLLYEYARQHDENAKNPGH